MHSWKNFDVEFNIHRVSPNKKKIFLSELRSIGENEEEESERRKKACIEIANIKRANVSGQTVGSAKVAFARSHRFYARSPPRLVFAQCVTHRHSQSRDDNLPRDVRSQEGRRRSPMESVSEVTVSDVKPGRGKFRETPRPPFKERRCSLGKEKKGEKRR